MSLKDTIALLIKNEVDKEEIYLKVGTATNVNVANNTFTFTPNDESAPVEGARLKAVRTSSGGSFIIKPAEGSLVAVGFIDTTNAVCLFVEEAQKVEVNSDLTSFNGGSNFGLVNIDPLTAKLNELVTSVNDLVSTFNSHAHTGVSTGGGTSGPPTASANNANNFNKGDYEDASVVH